MKGARRNMQRTVAHRKAGFVYGDFLRERPLGGVVTEVPVGGQLRLPGKRRFEPQEEGEG